MTSSLRAMTSIWMGHSTVRAEIGARIVELHGEIAVLASYLPARRAARIDLIIALRSE